MFAIIDLLFWVVVAATVWLATNLVGALVYTWLAGGGSWIIIGTLCVIGPTFVLSVLLVWGFDNSRLSEKDGKDHWFGGVYFWICSTFFCLPIILNGLSNIVHNAGYETAAHYLFAARYWSLFAPLSVMCFGLVAALGTIIAWRRIQQWTSGGYPPSPGSSSNEVRQGRQGNHNNPQPSTFRLAMVEC